MPLKLIRARSNASLWDACADRFLGQLGHRTGPSGYPAHLWLTHRLQRDALYREAARRGLRGWLAPPVAYFSDLPRLFEIGERPIGLLQRRALVGRLAAEHAREYGISGDPERQGMAGALDSLFGELLPEGVGVERLRDAMAGLDADDLARRRNAWLVAIYAAYLQTLAEQSRYDPRAIHARVADHIASGMLTTALRGAEHLLIYGIHSRRTRIRLLEALGGQSEVQVELYVPAEVDGGQPEFAGVEEWVDIELPVAPTVQPAPDGRRELEWVAGRIKRLLVDGKASADRIAIVTRTGREDSRRAYEALVDAGVPASARLRASLAEVPALKAVAQVFRAAASGWSYRPLRAVLASAYFDSRIDLRPIDYISSSRRVEGLEEWSRALRDLRLEVTRREKDPKASPARLHREGIFADRMARVCERFDRLGELLRTLDDPRPLAEWIEVTQGLLQGTWAEDLRFRSRICDADGLDYEVVRLDQQGVEALTGLLREWPAAGDAEPLDPASWYARLRRFLESNQLALSTPGQGGVRVLEAHEAALIPFQHVFVIHANDGEFPRRWVPGAIFSDEERVELARRGLPLTYRDLALRRERSLWRCVTANPHVTITYRTADHRGTPLLPSLMVPPHDEVDEIPRVRFVPEDPLNNSQAVQTAARALARGSDAVEVVDPVVLQSAIVNACAEARRRGDATAGSSAVDAWNGHVRDPVVLHRVRRRFGPDYRWSASSLERYGACPFLFLLDKVLSLTARDEAEEETTPLIVGSVAHDVLKRFYERVCPDPPASLDAGAERAFEDVFAQVCGERELEATRLDLWLGREPLWRLRREALRRDLKDYLQRELQHLAEVGERPVAFEYGFGNDADMVTIEWPDRDGNHRAIRVCGRIDRVDVGVEEGERVHRILDYKLGSTPSPAGYLTGATLQAPLYMKVFADREGVRVGCGRYRSLKPGDRIRDSATVEWDSDHFREALAHAVTIPDLVRDGRFPALLAASAQWRPWDPGPEVRRCDARRGEEDRSDEDD